MTPSQSVRNPSVPWSDSMGRTVSRQADIADSQRCVHQNSIPTFRFFHLMVLPPSHVRLAHTMFQVCSERPDGWRQLQDPCMLPTKQYTPTVFFPRHASHSAKRLADIHKSVLSHVGMSMSQRGVSTVSDVCHVTVRRVAAIQEILPFIPVTIPNARLTCAAVASSGVGGSAGGPVPG